MSVITKIKTEEIGFEHTRRLNFSAWFVVRLLIALGLILGLAWLVLKSGPKVYAGGSHQFVRSIDKNVVPSEGAPFTIGEIASMVTDKNGNLYVASGATIYKFSENGEYIKQWEANGTIGKLGYARYPTNPNTDIESIYKTGDNGIQIFDTEGMETGAIAINGALTADFYSYDSTPSYNWYGLGYSSGEAVTDIKSGSSDTLYEVNDDDTGSVHRYSLNSYGGWPDGVQDIERNKSSNGGYLQSFLMGSYGKVALVSGNGMVAYSWEGDPAVLYDVISQGKNGNVYVSDSGANVIRKFDNLMNPLMVWGEGGAGDTQFNNPGEITVSRNGDVYIDDIGNGKIKQYRDTLSVEVEGVDNYGGLVLDYVRPNTYFDYTIQTDAEVGDVLDFSILENGYGGYDDMPEGLNLNASTGEISGTIDSSVEVTDLYRDVIVRIRSSNGSFKDQHVLIRGAELSDPVNIETTTLPDWEFGERLDSTTSGYPFIELSGGQERALYPPKYSIVSGSLPPGVRLAEDGLGEQFGSNMNNGRLFGTPGAPGTYTFTVRVESTDPLVPGYDEQELSITVPNPAPLEPFMDSNWRAPIVEVERVEKLNGVTTVYGDAPANQQVKVYMDGAEVGVVQSAGDGSWSFSSPNITDSTHSFSASWVTDGDILFSVSSTLNYFFINLQARSSVQMIDFDSGVVLKNIYMPDGFWATGVVPSPDKSKIFVAGLYFDGVEPNVARILEYDVASERVSFISDIASVNGSAILRLNRSGSKLYILASSGVYVVDTATRQIEFITNVDIYRSSYYFEQMELNEDEDKLFIPDEAVSTESNIAYSRDVIVVDLASKATHVERTGVQGAVPYSDGYFSDSSSAVFKRGAGFVVVYRDGNIVTLDEDGNTLEFMDFDLERPVLHQESNTYSGGREMAISYGYDQAEDSIYAIIWKDDDVIVGSNSPDYYLRKISLQNGEVEASYLLPVFDGNVFYYSQPVFLISKDGQSAIIQSSAASSMAFFVDTYRLNLANGEIQRLDRDEISIIDPTQSDFEGVMMRNWIFKPNAASVLSGFGAHSSSLVVEVVNQEVEQPGGEDLPDKPNIDETTEEGDGGTTTNEEALNPDNHQEVAEDVRDNSSREDSGGTGLVRGMINSLASFFGVAPITVVRVFPWLFVLMLFILAGLAVAELIKQLIVVAKLKRLVERQELLNHEKTWLLALSSHYLRTPLTIINSGQELAQDPIRKEKLRIGTSGLSLVIHRMVDSLRNDQIVADVEAPDLKQYKHASFLRPRTLVPSVVILGLLVVINLVFTFNAKLYPGAIHIFSQMCGAIIGVGVLYFAYDTRAQKRELEEYRAQLLKYGEGLDRARNHFVKNMAEDLMPEVIKAQGLIPNGLPKISEEYIKKGLSQLEETAQKFLLISQLEKQALRQEISEFKLRGTVEEAKAQSKHPDSPLKVMVADGNELNQPEFLLRKVFQSLLDNAAEHGKSEVPAEVGSVEGKNSLKIAIADHGEGIAPNKLQLLFKPLSKVEEDFASQGMGLSLYLNRLIMHYLGGEIMASSKVGVGTTMTVEVPRELT